MQQCVYERVCLCRHGVLWAGTLSQLLADLLRLQENPSCFAADTSLFGARVDVPHLFSVFFEVIPAFVPVYKVRGMPVRMFCCVLGCKRVSEERDYVCV